MIAEIKLRARFLPLMIARIGKRHFNLFLILSHLIISTKKKKSNLEKLKKTTNLRLKFSSFAEVAKLNLYIRFKFELLE